MEADLKDKLDEAKFFLLEMEKHAHQIDPFRYSLSAFLNAVYNFIEYMRKKAKEIPEEKKWIKDELEKIKYHEYLYAQRRLSTHHRPIADRGPADVYQNQSGANSTLYYLTGTAATVRILTPTPQSSAPFLWYFEDFLDEDVISISRKWVHALEEMPAKFLTKFGH